MVYQYCKEARRQLSLRFVNSVDSSHVQNLFVDLQVDVVHCGTVQATLLSASHSRLVALLSFSRADYSSELMVIFVNFQVKKTIKQVEKQS